MKELKQSIIVDGKFYQIRTIVEAPHPIDRLAIDIIRGQIKW